MPFYDLGSLGYWDATTNIPPIKSGRGENGRFYRVGVAGTTEIDGITDWQVGDLIMFVNDSWIRLLSNVGLPASVVNAVEAGIGAAPGAQTAIVEALRASKSEALDPDEDTSSNIRVMTPLRVLNAIKALEPFNPKWFGCVGDGVTAKATANTAGWNALFSAVEENTREYDILPPGDWPTPAMGRPWYALIGREVNARGGVYAIDGQLEFRGAFGMLLRNASFISVDDGWSGQSALKCSSTTGMAYAPSQTTGVVFDNVNISCNKKSSGLEFVGGNRFGRIADCKVSGFGGVDGGFGMKVSTSIECELRYNQVYGSDLFGNVPPEATNNATGFVLDQGDFKFVANKNFRTAVGVKLGDVAGVQMYHNHLHAFAASGNRPAIFLDRASNTGHIMIHDNYIDSSVIWVRGHRNVEIIDNRQLCLSINATPAPTYFVNLIARATGEVIEQFHMRGNRAQAPSGVGYTPLVLTQNDGNTFTGLRFSEVGDHKIMVTGATAVYGRKTFGEDRATCTTAAFDGSDNIYIPMQSLLLLGDAASPAQFDLVSCIGRSTDSGSASFFPLEWNYNRTTQKLRLKFAAPFNGHINFSYTWGHQTLSVTGATS